MLRNNKFNLNCINNNFNYYINLVKPVLGMQRYGKNFAAISEALGTKNISHLKTFYVHYRKRYKLDTILKKYESDHNSIIELSDDDDEQVSYIFQFLIV